MHLIVDFKLNGPIVDICRDIVSLSPPFLLQWTSRPLGLVQWTSQPLADVATSSTYSGRRDLLLTSRPQVLTVDVATSG